MLKNPLFWIPGIAGLIVLLGLRSQLGDNAVWIAPVVFMAGGLAFGFWIRRRVDSKVVLGREIDGAVEFAPIWICSAQHFARFDRAYRSSSWADRLTGQFELPEDMPYTSLKTILWTTKVPLTFEALGTLRVGPNTMQFAATKTDITGNPTMALHNLDVDMTFELNFHELSVVELVEHESPVGRRFSQTWIRIVGGGPDGLIDTRLAVGGAGLESLRQNTVALFEAIQAKRSAVGPSPSAAQQHG